MKRTPQEITVILIRPAKPDLEALELAYQILASSRPKRNSPTTTETDTSP